jgi:hypothetical protein
MRAGASDGKSSQNADLQVPLLHGRKEVGDRGPIRTVFWSYVRRTYVYQVPVGRSKDRIPSDGK